MVVADFDRDSKPDIVSLTADESFIALVVFGDLPVMRRSLRSAPPPPFRCPGDADDDGMVCGNDLSLIVSGIQFGVPVFPNNDLNADSLVDGRDLSILLANFGRTCP